MFHVAEKPSRDLGWGNQKAHIQEKRLLDHLASFDYFLCWESVEHVALKNLVLHFQYLWSVMIIDNTMRILVTIKCRTITADDFTNLINQPPVY